MPSLSSFLPTVKPGVPRSTRNAVMPAIARLGIRVGKDDEQARFLGIGNPKFAAVQNEVVAVLASARRERKGVAAGIRLRKRVGAQRVAHQTGEDISASAPPFPIS